MIKYNHKKHNEAVAKISKLYNRHSIAVDRLERFSARLYSLLNERDFDLIVFPGNSGLMMMGITEIVYDHLHKKMPKYIEIPVYRDGTDYNEVFDIPVVTEVLVIDDEIMTGTSVKTCIEATLRSVKNASHINFTIVAENMFFEWHHRIPGVSVFFYPYARAIAGLTNNISRILNDSDFKKLSKYIPMHGEKKQVMALLLSGKVKLKDNNGRWYFDEVLEGKIVNRTIDYAKIKRQCIDEITIYIKSGIEKYKDKKISFVGG